ncbi:sensor histidine kinase [Scardovia wiggsiae]|uniref:sensor histidine kinase n=1 Tax=Scardovia wiggsiae TaxID=230143 RepID=UPI00374F7EAB
MPDRKGDTTPRTSSSAPHHTSPRGLYSKSAYDTYRMQQEQARKAGRGTSPRKKRPSGARPRKKPSAVRPIGVFTSLKAELSILIIISTAITFLMSWFLLQYGVSGWIAMPLTLVAALGVTYIFSHGLTSPLGEIRDAAEQMQEGNYEIRVTSAVSSRDEVGQLARSFNAMAEELEHADQMRRDLIANVSHELRTPVSALQAQVENMADGVIEPTPANLDGLLSQTMRLTDLIAFLLDMSRVEAGAASLEITEFNVKDFIDDVVKPLEIADGGHGHMISLDVPPNITMEGDQDRLRQLYTNIVSNAIKHSADGTAVLVEVHEDRVHDTIVSNIINFGSQISQEARSDIFRRYVKGQGSRPGTGSGGTGLGLSIARWAAQLHSGTVRVVDDSRGANFEITLPKHHNIPLIDEQL